MSTTERRVEWGGSEYDRQRYQAKKSELLAILGNCCKLCSSTDGLEFDHIDPKTKSFTVMVRWKDSIESLLPEIMKCQLLCKSCHIAKSKETKTVPHGGGKSGKRNCKCLPCKTRKSEYMKAYKANNP